jgi:hypothetical protein
MINLKIALILYGAINIVEGALMWLVPGWLVKTLFNVSYVASQYHYSGYIFVVLGAASIAAGLLMVVAAMQPLKNINAVRFTILWGALILVGQWYSLIKEYITWGDIAMPVLLNLVFLLALVVFYPWRPQPKVDSTGV